MIGPFALGALIGAVALFCNVLWKSWTRGLPIQNWFVFVVTTGLGGALWGLVILGPLFWIISLIVK